MKTELKKIKEFGIVFSIILMIVGGIQLHKGNGVAFNYLALCSGITFIVTLTLTQAIRPLYRLFMGFAKVMGWINTKILLSIIFYVIFTPISIVLRILGKNLLEKQTSENSYWHNVKIGNYNKDNYERQF